MIDHNSTSTDEPSVVCASVDAMNRKQSNPDPAHVLHQWVDRFGDQQSVSKVMTYASFIGITLCLDAHLVISSWTPDEEAVGEQCFLAAYMGLRV